MGHLLTSVAALEGRLSQEQSAEGVVSLVDEPTGDENPVDQQIPLPPEFQCGDVEIPTPDQVLGDKPVEPTKVDPPCGPPETSISYLMQADL